MIARLLSRLARTPNPPPAVLPSPAPDGPSEAGFPPGSLDGWRPSWAVMGTPDVGMRAWQSDHVWRPLQVDGQAQR